MHPRAELVEPLITERSKVLILNSPGNPTGSVTPRAHLQELIELAAERGLWVVSDEVYDELVFEGEVAPSAGAFDDHGCVVTVFSFSKTYAMTGWRVGYAVAPPDVASLIIKAQEPITACVNGPAQMAALAALEGPQRCVALMRDAYRERRDGVVKLLAGAGVPHVEPQGAFYVWTDVSGSGLDGVEFARRLLRESSVAVAPGLAFGPRGNDFVRVSLAASPTELYDGVERLLGAVAEWSH
jgi:aspartate/methionine/tyrosine aminotransferase